jgi:hypothetical protein
LILQKTEKYEKEAEIVRKKIKRVERLRDQAARDYFKQQIVGQLFNNDVELSKLFSIHSRFSFM